MGVDATATLIALTDARNQAAGKVTTIETQARAAGQALGEAREALAEFERGDGRASPTGSSSSDNSRRPRCSSGSRGLRGSNRARRRVRDAVAAIAEHVRSTRSARHRGSRAGRPCRGGPRRHRSPGPDRRQPRLAEQVGRGSSASAQSRPDRYSTDVSGTRSDAGGSLPRHLLASGGEQPPTVDRRRPPWDVLLGTEDDVVEVEVADVVSVTARTARIAGRRGTDRRGARDSPRAPAAPPRRLARRARRGSADALCRLIAGRQHRGPGTRALPASSPRVVLPRSSARGRSSRCVRPSGIPRPRDPSRPASCPSAAWTVAHDRRFRYRDHPSASTAR